MTETEYYILSLKWSKDDYLTWWRPDNAGYTWEVDDAGLYSQSEIDARPGYYNNGASTLAVPKEVVDRISKRAVRRANLDVLRGEVSA